MPIYKAWDIVKVPFPYIDRPVRERRPALVIAAGRLETERALLWVLMITSAENRGWVDDVEISDIERAGLPAASVVRSAKIATIECDDAEKIGRLPLRDRTLVAEHVRRRLGEID
ncbi:MAG: type II toxin-antitoxin system PemK/MazF family toxin [Candidatus Baltobacteraceae bacterium]